MNCELLALIGKLQRFEDWAIEKGGVPPVYTKAVREATIRLVAMDARITRLDTTPIVDSYAEDELDARRERERLEGNNYGGL